MKFMKLISTAALLLSFIAPLFPIISPAFAGQGCGSNWLGSDTNDQDFWVSKNQNQETSRIGIAETVGTKPATVSLGSSTARIGNSSIIQDLIPDIPSPQKASASITWTANVINQSKKGVLLYNFLLNGPSTKGQSIEQTGWIAENTWTWNTTEADVGDNKVEVRVKYGGSMDIEDNKTMSYLLISSVQKDINSQAATASDSHPSSRTGNSLKNKPRTAPDEMPRSPPSNPSGPNMSMPDPNPREKDQTGNRAENVQAIEASSESTQSKILDVTGKWTMKLANTDSSLDLILIQTGETIMGSGKLNEQNTQIPVTAKGFVARNSLVLDVKTVVAEYVNQIDKSFKLNLVKADRLVSGNYEAYSGKSPIGKGNVTASSYGP